MAYHNAKPFLKIELLNHSLKLLAIVKREGIVISRSKNHFSFNEPEVTVWIGHLRPYASSLSPRQASVLLVV